LGKSLKVRAMKNERQGDLGLLERTLREFKQKGNSSIEDIKEYLLNKYQLSVSYSALRKRMESASF
jgi:hypothetical protein